MTIRDATAEVTIVAPRADIAFSSPTASVSFVALSATDLELLIIIFQTLADTVAFTDTTTFSTSLGFSDTPVLLDVLTIDSSKSLSDTYSLSDVASLNPQKPVADSVSSADSTVWDFAKNPSDAISITDIFEMLVDYGRSMDDGLLATDALAFDVDKILSDTYSILESLVLDLTKPLAGDTLSMGDNISVLSISTESSRLNHSVLGTFLFNH